MSPKNNDNNDDDDDPFSSWSELIHKRVYSIDGKNLGFLRRMLSDYMVVGGGLINLKKIFYPKIACRVNKQKRDQTNNYSL